MPNPDTEIWSAKTRRIRIFEPHLFLDPSPAPVSSSKMLDESSGLPASADGNLLITWRETVDDVASGDATIIDFPMRFPFHLVV
jgi:hypothetical protein